MYRRPLVIVTVLAAVCTLGLVFGKYSARPVLPARFIPAGTIARIDPDYSGCTIPPNIAPLNFVIKEPGLEFLVKAYCNNDNELVVVGSGSKIMFPRTRWNQLLSANAGGALHFDIYSRGSDGKWRKYDTISNRIAMETIDPYIAYRRLKPLYNKYTRMGIYQRNVETFKEIPILLGDKNGCVNCHTFVNNNPEQMILHMRGKKGVAMLLARGKSVSKINTRTRYNASPAAYSSWHPSGEALAFSVNKLGQYFHSIGEPREVFDFKSDLALYLVEPNKVVSTRRISDPGQLETFPSWSPDGKYLFFCRTPLRWNPKRKDERKGPPFQQYKFVQYDLMRIGYDIKTGTWGELETILSSEDTGLSILEPRVSPNGRFVLLCLTQYGNFPIYQDSADLYMLDLLSGRYWPLKHNSQQTDSWHSWSSNGHWIAYVSKRRDNLFSKIYFSYIDETGRDHKPLLLPQKDPTFYDSLLDNYNAPELASTRIPWTARDFEEAIVSSQEGQAADVISGATPNVGQGENTAPEEVPEEMYSGFQQ